MDEKDMKAKIEEGNKFHQDYIEGTKYMVPQKHNDWLRFVSNCYKRSEIDSVKSIIDVLKDLNLKNEFSLIKEKVDKKIEDGIDFNLVVNAIVRFGTKGPEFFEYLCPKMNAEARQFVNQQKLKNRQYDYELKYGEPEENSLCKDY